MKILNLFAGLGGNRTRWGNVNVTAVEINPQIASIYHSRFAYDETIVQDVYEFLQEEDINQYDFIWASPPCQSHSHMQVFTKKDRLPKIPRADETLGLALWLKRVYHGRFVIENVVPWYGIITLSGIYWNIILRHLFYSNYPITPLRLPKGANKHGKKGGIMRESREELLRKYELPEWILERLKGVHDKDQIIRNCVLPKLGKYILDQGLTPGLVSYIDA